MNMDPLIYLWELCGRATSQAPQSPAAQPASVPKSKVWNPYLILPSA